ncbi:hypothetical protein K4F52_009305 [Lecanicillium sp. MT-2017a]|nr:hypothetical protein K4F52_009305 [Lecanicillium sp. MT-2017a]
MQTPTPPPELVTVPVAVPVATNVTATQPADSAQDSTPTATANDAAAKKDDDPNNQESVTKADEADSNAITNPATEQEATTGEDTTPKDETPAAPPQLMQSMWRCHQCECTTFCLCEEGPKSRDTRAATSTGGAAPPRTSRHYARARRNQRYHPYARSPPAAISPSFPMGLWPAGEDRRATRSSSYPAPVPMLRYRLHRVDGTGTTILAIALRINVETDPPVYDVRNVPPAATATATATATANGGGGSTAPTPRYITVDTEPLCRLVVRGAERIVARRAGVVAPLVCMYVEPTFAYLVYSCARAMWDRLLRFWFVRWMAWDLVSNRRQWGLS